MSQLNAQDVIESLPEDWTELATLAQSKPFSVRKTSNGVIVRPTTGEERPITIKQIQEVCTRYAQTKSDKRSDYNDLNHHGSYILAIINHYYTLVLSPQSTFYHYPDELQTTSMHSEGAVRQVVVNIYERHPTNRKKCIDYHGCKCVICNFDFEAVYGAVAKGFIHVHHLTPLSKIGKGYSIDPIKELRPVCPNCHAAIHMEDPPMSIKKVQSLIRASQTRS